MRAVGVAVVASVLAWSATGLVRNRAVNAGTAAETSQTPPLASSPSGPWINIGPAPLAYVAAPTNPRNFNSGRVAALAVDPSDANHWLVGVGNGGVWGSRNAGSTWAPLTDAQPTLATGAIAFAPSDPRIVYVGTGEPGGGIGFAKSGLGMLKSLDGGSTWSLLAASTFARASVRRVRVHPSDPDTLLAISGRGGYGRDSREGTPFAPPYGVWRSIDGALTWTRTLAGQATALEVDATNFARQYAAIGDQRVGVLNDSPGSATNGVYRSTDGGLTWTVVAGPWGTAAPPLATVGRIELALAPSNPNVLYAGIQVPPNQGTSSTGLLGLYRTDNAWAPVPTWILVPTAATGPGGYCGPTKCGYVHNISVDPDDANILAAGGAEQGFWRCASCGAAPVWSELTTTAPVHSDLHAIAWAGRRLIVGNDGGVWSTADVGASWQNHNATLSTGMFFSGALHPTVGGAILGGLRDFQTSVLRPGVGWVILPPGPGFEWGEAEVALSATRPDTDWMSGWIFGRVQRTVNGGATVTRADAGIDFAGAAFVAPVRKCPANDNVFLTGTNRVWRTNNFFNSAAPTWSANGPAHPFPSPGGLNAPGTILAIAFVAADATCNTYAWGNRGGQIQWTRDGGASWGDLDPGHTLPARPVNSLAFDPSNPDVLYAALSSFDNETPGKPGHMFRTANARGAPPVWTDVSPPADVPFNVVALDPRNTQLVYAGTDTGLWQSTDGATTWARVGLASGLPPAPVYDIQINPVTDRTVVFTYGRGAYVLAATPSPPGALAVSVSGNVVDLTWTAPAGVPPASYVVHAGSASGLSNIVDVDTGSLATALRASGVPNGTYFVRMHARNSFGSGPPSNEVTVTVGPPACSQPPGVPGTLSSSVVGLVATLSWQPAAGATAYRIEAGSAPTLANLAVLDVGPVTSFQTGAPPGTYFVRVRGLNACGVGPASNEVPLIVGVSLPGPPINLAHTVSSGTVTVTWDPPTTGGAVVSYLLEAGTAPGAANLVVVPVAGSPLVAQNVPAGTYFVRVRARNQTGVGPPTADVAIAVP